LPAFLEDAAKSFGQHFPEDAAKKFASTFSEMPPITFPDF
jgi:hypothetical protein